MYTQSLLMLELLLGKGVLFFLFLFFATCLLLHWGGMSKMEGSLMPGVTSDTSRLYTAPLPGSEEETKYITCTGKHPGKQNMQSN